ncbi:putative glutathione-specific gamma-glutamylcyclotransferase 2 isoform X2 [Culicoides brevitarsis]|uniref:putative glutathione-specific gamma-glutamylcyclotransferase 2 isoform X2 n=1 Tax=Culicoides brevitarsis TaxID=469753 RepID=UPI00307C6B43
MSPSIQQLTEKSPKKVYNVQESLKLLCPEVICGNDDDSLWIFGYGSLVWKADFPFSCKHKGFITGFERKFYQNSIDHRGTAEKPGRVVTLIHTENSENRVYGIGYRISADDKKAVLEHLDVREINGYERVVTDFHLLSDAGEILARKSVLLYLAKHDNPSFAGLKDDLETIAQQICECEGKSGRNSDYLMDLAESMRILYPEIDDRHLFELEKVVKRKLCHEV